MASMILRRAAFPALVSLALAACKDPGAYGFPDSGADDSDIQGSADGCGTCAYVFVNGGIPCGPGPSSDAFDALSACACAGPCGSACGASLCTTAPVDPMCGQCLQASCGAQQTRCTQN